MSDIAARVGLTTNLPCGDVFKTLEQQGVIKRESALLDANKLNLRFDRVCAG